MTLAITANAILGLFLAVIVLSLLAGAIVRSRTERRLTLGTRQRPARDQRRSAARPRAGWAARPDAF